MNKSNRTKVVVTLLAMILISSSLFAMGMKESDPAAVTVRILTTMNQNGQVTLVARSADNQDLTFQADPTPMQVIQSPALVQVIMWKWFSTTTRR